ncbi:MAG TPA: sigma-70 family RNA polymerase sigma factor [Deltaproteobacteria bacterium]|nr:sigma-70 family RNA polymerase sigma factor [Deltaproteobacteria bacterium]
MQGSQANFSSYRELDAEEEIELGRKILSAERRTFEALQGLDCVRGILERVPSGRYKTRAGWVENLEEAVHTTWEISRREPELREIARGALQAWSEADGLRWCLAMSQQRIAFHEARKLASRMMDRADLTQEGYVGLLRAAKRFDPERGLRFSTYARWWVRAQITRAIDQHGRVVRLPGAAVEQLRNLRKAQLQHEQGGGEWTITELAEEAGVDRERAEFLLSRGEAVSLDEPTDDGVRSRPLSGMLSDEEAIDPLVDVIERQETHRALAAVEDLDERQRFVVTSRFGLNGDQPKSLAEVGRLMSLSRERVRQLEKEALRALRSDSRIREFA